MNSYMTSFWFCAAAGGKKTTVSKSESVQYNLLMSDLLLLLSRTLAPPGPPRQKRHAVDRSRFIRWEAAPRSGDEADGGTVDPVAGGSGDRDRPADRRGQA